MTKIFLSGIISIIMFLAVAFKCSAERKPWRLVDSFACYYGKGKVAELSQFDVVIIEARNHSREEISRLKNAGAWVIGYISVGETATLQKGNGKGPGGYASWYFDRNKKNYPDDNVNWNSYYVNAGDPAWRDFVINKKMKKVLKDKGCDGIFMDTVDTALLYPESVDGMIELISEMKKTYPKNKLISNRGLYLLKRTAPYLDGLMFESFTSGYDFAAKKYKIKTDNQMLHSAVIAIKTINSARHKYNFPVFVLDYAQPGDKNFTEQCVRRARKFNFIPWVSNIYLDVVKPLPIFPNIRRGSFANNMPEYLKANGINIPPGRNNPYNVAASTNGGTVLVSSCYDGYFAFPINDGRVKAGLPWFLEAWASQEVPKQSQWVEIKPARECHPISLNIYWVKPSTEIIVQVPSRKGQWRDYCRVEPSSKEQKSVVDLSGLKAPISKVRLYQPPGRGPADRPNIMWIRELELDIPKTAKQ